MSMFERRAATGLFLAAAALACGCGSDSSQAKPLSVVARIKSELARPYLSMRAPDAPAGGEFDRVPLDLWGPFEWEITFGVFDESRVGGLENAFFGTELDSRGQPTETYFGIYAQPQAAGLLVFGEWEDAATGYHGLNSVTYPGVLVVEARIEHDGTSIRFFSRPKGSTAAFDDLGTVPFSPQPFPLNPAFGVFDFTGNAEVGFDAMRVVSNSAPPAPVSAAHAAVNAVLGAIGSFAEARYALTVAIPDPAAASAHLDTAGAKVEAADAAVAALATGETLKASKKSRKALKKARKRLAKMKARLANDGAAAAPKVLKDIAASFLSLAQSADAVLPQDLRDSLPGTVHSLK
jgi:hypothetical protein